MVAAVGAVAEVAVLGVAAVVAASVAQLSRRPQLDLTQRTSPFQLVRAVVTGCQFVKGSRTLPNFQESNTCPRLVQGAPLCGVVF